eukprot:scaffold20460_cov54-Cylindrotheca_fusiformis.AAC.1
MSPTIRLPNPTWKRRRADWQAMTYNLHRSGRVVKAFQWFRFGRIPQEGGEMHPFQPKRGFEIRKRQKKPKLGGILLWQVVTIPR